MLDFYDKRLQQLNTLIEITGIINSSLDTSVIRKKVIEAATRLLDTEAGSLLLLDQKTGELFFEVALGEKGDKLKPVRLQKGLVLPAGLHSTENRLLQMMPPQSQDFSRAPTI